MHTLWVVAHPDQHTSLNARLRDVGVRALRRQGWTVDLSDLYAEAWDPVLRAEGGPDVAAAQRRLRCADLLVVQFPLWWYGMPAILKGWIDRVFQSGFAYDVVDPATGRARKYGDGGLAGKRALAVVTAGDRPGSLQPRGISGSIADVLWPLLHGTFWYTGMSPLHPFLVTEARGLDARGVSHVGAALTARLGTVPHEAPIDYLAMDEEHYDHSIRLRGHINPGREGNSAHCAT